MVWYARLREKHLPKPRRLTAEPRSRALRVALTLTVSISSKRWKSSRAMSQPRNFHPQSSESGLSYPKLWSNDLDLLGGTPIPPIVG